MKARRIIIWSIFILIFPLLAILQQNTGTSWNYIWSLWITDMIAEVVILGKDIISLSSIGGATIFWILFPIAMMLSFPSKVIYVDREVIKTVNVPVYVDRIIEKQVPVYIEEKKEQDVITLIPVDVTGQFKEIKQDNPYGYLGD